MLGSLSARDPDEHSLLGTVDAESRVLDDEVNFRVLLIDLVTIACRDSKGREHGAVDRVEKLFNLFLEGFKINVETSANVLADFSNHPAAWVMVGDAW